MIIFMAIIHLTNYRVIEEIGRGGMGVVYLAEDLTLGRLVALKVLRPDLAQDVEFKERFRIEARNQARLIHSNITTVYSFHEEDGHVFLVMEYVPGETLEKRILRQGRLSAAETATIFPKILEAVAYAHGKGMIHRDLKPGNICITPQGDIKIMDFGIALDLKKDITAKTVEIIGTSYYMAPEQIKGDITGPGTDIYALGVTLFELLTGRVPFEGSNDYDIRLAHLSRPPPSILSFGYPDLTPKLEQVIQKALAKNPSARFANARTFLRALEASIGGRLSAPMPEGEVVSPSRAPTVPSTPPLEKAPWVSHVWLSRKSFLIFMPMSLIFVGVAISWWLFLPGRGKIPVATTSLSAFSKSTTPTPTPPPLAKKETLLTSAVPHLPDPGQMRQGPDVEAPPDLPTLVQSLRNALKDRGFGHLKVEPHNRKIVISGRVNSLEDRDSVITLAVGVNPSIPLDTSSIKIRKVVVRAVEPTETAVEREATPVKREERPTPPIKSRPPNVVPKFEFGTPKVTKIR